MDPEKWLIVCAAWNNVTVEQMRATQARMPEGSREAWERVYEAVASSPQRTNTGDE